MNDIAIVLARSFASLDQFQRERLSKYASAGGDVFCGSLAGENFISPDGVPTPEVVSVSSEPTDLRWVPRGAAQAFATMSGATNCRYVGALMAASPAEVRNAMLECVR